MRDLLLVRDLLLMTLGVAAVFLVVLVPINWLVGKLLSRKPPLAK
jgi:Na+-transporting methylmalonyl-CoA/oxaloacetate decarboxylase gamma subunit